MGTKTDKQILKSFKPQLIPNFKKGAKVVWEELIENPKEWIYAEKLDGARVEILENGTILGRSLKKVPSIKLQQMAKTLAARVGFKGILEAELWSPNMTFPEIIHFFRTEDVTSESTRKKYERLWKKTYGGTQFIINGKTIPMEYYPHLNKEDKKKAIKWEFPGRDVKWLTTWHDDLKFYVFDHINPDGSESLLKLNRVQKIKDMMDSFGKEAVVIAHWNFNSLEELYEEYDHVINRGGEGLVITRQYSVYKYGRHTLRANTIYKMKNDNNVYDGQILAVEEATYVDPNAPKTINELGRSVTSKLKEHRLPAGYAKGFLVRMDDGRELTVGLQGYDREALTNLYNNRKHYVGKWITFTGMEPVKEGGNIRHAFFETWRDDK